MYLERQWKAVAETTFGFKAACCWLVFVVLAVLCGPLLTGWDYAEIDWDAIDAAPSTQHLFGTDSAGRDLLTRLLLGGRVSLAIAILATFISFFIGMTVGSTAGYLGGWVDHLLMRIVDGLYAIPFVLVVILLVVLFGRSIYLLFLGLGALSWLDIARICRGQALVVAQQGYILSARSMGLGGSQILRRHVVPNVLNPAIVYATLTIPGVIIAESFISYLGLGVQEPLTSWGVLIANGTKNIHASPWQLTFPTLLLASTLFALYVVSDYLQEHLTLLRRTEVAED